MGQVTSTDSASGSQILARRQAEVFGAERFSPKPEVVLVARRKAPTSAPAVILEEEIRRLRNDLYLTRRALIGLTSDAAQRILFDYHDCKTREDVFRWLGASVEKLIEMADQKPARQMGDYGGFGDRAYCPLCGRGSDNPYGQQGFAYPGGLERHLEGSYNARQCDVMKAALDMALDQLKDEPKLGPVA